MFFCLRNTLELDAARPVSDMAAFFDYQLAPSAALTLTLARERGCVSVCLQGAEQSFTASEPCSEAAASGEVTRCVKLVVLKVFAELTGLQPKLPWGILTGVRPTKLAHKLLDSGVAAAALPEYLSDNYLLPLPQGRLLTDIALKQKHILSDSTRFTDTGIYIGVPYCPSRCSYCSFPAGIVPQDEESQQNFVNMIEQDLQNVVQLIGMHSLRVKSLYIGGGTPTSLSDKVFARLLQAVERKLRVLKEHGIERISVNPQSFHDKTLQLIGRRHSVRDFYNAYELVRKSRIPVVNVDLIIGLPQETEQEIAYSLEQAVKLAPENLTVHTLTLKRSAPLFQKQEQAVLTTQAAETMVQRAAEMAAAIGLEPYYLYRQHYMLGHLANIGYAKPGTESIYNIQMMEERHPVIGVGPASASKVPLPDGHHLHKLNMPKNVAVYGARLQELAERRRDLFNIEGTDL